MKTTKLLGIALLAISLGLSGCEGLRSYDELTDSTNPTIRPQKIDMTGVQGFAIVENNSNAPRTKADVNGDGVDDDIPNGNGGEMANTSPYALYTIDENGELHVSIFYFEVVPSEDGSTDASYTEVLKEVSKALQIVPSLVTDLGKYILFSGCKYQIIASDISEEALSICHAHISKNTKLNMTYMIRKSDGGLFDLSDQPIFSYYANSYNSWHFDHSYCNNYDPNTGRGNRWTYIPEFTYTTSSKGNLFIRGTYISKIEDKRNSITVKQMTLYPNTNTPSSSYRNFAVDNDENIYDIFLEKNEKVKIDIYNANSGYNIYELKASLVKTPILLDIDVVTDESGIPYIFLIGEGKIINNGVGQHVMIAISAVASNGTVAILKEDIVQTPFKLENKVNCHYLGYYNNCFNWFLQYTPRYGTSMPLGDILSYNNTTHTWSLNPIASGLMSMISANYDVLISGKKFYGIYLNGNDIEVTEIDIVSESTRKYTLTIDIPAIVSPSYNACMVQNTPYFTIEGRNTINGAGVSITVNLINGDNNSTFASDTRKVVSFFRIN